MSPPLGTWDRPETVAGFVASPPNGVLMRQVVSFSEERPLNILDIGCGAGRNALPLAALGHHVVGIDASVPMLEAARKGAMAAGLLDRCDFRQGSMEDLDVPDQGFDFIIAHGIWNLAASDRQLVAAVAEASRAARSGAGLFVFTFSRNTLAPDVAPFPGERWVFTRFSGAPQVFLSEEQLTALLHDAGFDRDPEPLTEYNLPWTIPPGGSAPRPVIWEGLWHRVPRP